jgi:hypothetical protein
LNNHPKSSQANNEQRPLCRKQSTRKFRNKENSSKRSNHNCFDLQSTSCRHCKNQRTTNSNKKANITIFSQFKEILHEKENFPHSKVSLNAENNQNCPNFDILSSKDLLSKSNWK